MTDLFFKDALSLKQWLDEASRHFNQPSFIADDPISVPHRFSKKQDIEIAGLLTAILSWGRRKSIIKGANHLMDLMDSAPFDFIMNHSEKEGRRMSKFVYRTFQPDDLLGLIRSLQLVYQQSESLESAFMDEFSEEMEDVEFALRSFSKRIFNHQDILERTRKHIPSPERNSGCKRLNMFLRWMVRKDTAGVDFGIWTTIKPNQLIIPLDVHVGNVARKLGLLERDKNDWKAAKMLTDRLKEFDPDDPVKYDFALFGAGVLGNKITF